MAGREFSYDPVTGIRKIWHYDNRTDTAVIQSTQDVSGIIDQNKLERNSGVNEKDHGLGKKVATIPLTLYYKWKNECKERGFDQKESGAYILAKINSRDYCKFKTVDSI